MDKSKLNYNSNLESYDTSDSFIERHIGSSESEIKECLNTLGYESLEELTLDTIPNQILSDIGISLDPPLSESKALESLSSMIGKNKKFKSYIGMGYYDTMTPNVILRNILENPGWYTAYTPYQPEVSQGRLEMLINFQQVIMDLTGLEVSNASLLDEGTSAVEAMLLAYRSSKESKNIFLVSEFCHPQTVDLLITRGRPLGINVVVGDLDSLFVTHTDNFFGFIAQYPNTLGEVKDFEFLINHAKSQNAISILATDLLSLVLLKTPGEMGADIAIGSSQRFGVPLGFGGPHAAFIACKDQYKRLLPGRIIGRSIDKNSEVAYRMALQTREQHIRREKATSNICTAQSLLAITAAAYAMYHGPTGLKEISLRVHRYTRLVAKALQNAGFELLYKSFFDTIAIKSTNLKISNIKKKSLGKQINFRFYSKEIVSLSIDETTSLNDLHEILSCFISTKNFDFNSIDNQLGESLPAIAKSLMRKTSYLDNKVFNNYKSETDFLRYLKKLEDKDIALNKSMIPLGSCTMKLNATAEMIPISWPIVNSIHPFVPRQQSLGYKVIIDKLKDMLCKITGFDEVSLQPNAGAQGELAGLMTIKAFLEATGEASRDICLIPSSAHGTNPASAILAGMRVEIIKCDENGNVDTKDLAYKIQEFPDQIAALMVTYPSTHGVYEESISKICNMVHEAGGQVYMDGANLNALVGVSKPGNFGPDLCHINLHKTFCIPHGGGGPGVGPIAVKAHLSKFIPNHCLNTDAGPKSGFGPISSAPWGSASILPISLIYIMMMGAEGIKKATQVAILNANYIANKINKHFDILYTGRNGRVAHECIIDLREIKKNNNISEEDIAKRLIDYGFHAPTMSFPVPGTLMIEPTESESKKEIDRFCDALISIRSEINTYSMIENPQDSPLKNAPHSFKDLIDNNFNYLPTTAYPVQNSLEPNIRYIAPVARVNNAYGDKNFVCSCLPIEMYSEK